MLFIGVISCRLHHMVSMVVLQQAVGQVNTAL